MRGVRQRNHENVNWECIAVEPVLASQRRSRFFTALLPSLLALALGLQACEAPTPSAQGNTGKQFRTTDPSRLFFNNIRASSYDFEYGPENSGTELYRYRRFSQVSQRPILIPVLALAPIKHEAYILIEADELVDIATPLRVRSNKANVRGAAYRLQTQNLLGQDSFATQLYSDIRTGNKLEIQLADSTFMPLYESRAARSAFLGVMRDYFRLTERI